MRLLSSRPRRPITMGFLSSTGLHSQQGQPQQRHQVFEALLVGPQVPKTCMHPCLLKQLVQSCLHAAAAAFSVRVVGCLP